MCDVALAVLKSVVTRVVVEDELNRQVVVVKWILV